MNRFEFHAASFFEKDADCVEALAIQMRDHALDEEHVDGPTAEDLIRDRMATAVRVLSLYGIPHLKVAAITRVPRAAAASSVLPTDTWGKTSIRIAVAPEEFFDDDVEYLA